MLVFHVKAEPVAASGPPATAYVVAEDADEAVLLLRKDIAFSGYRLPPAEMTPVVASAAEVRRALGDAAAQEKGVYAFQAPQQAAPGPATG